MRSLLLCVAVSALLAPAVEFEWMQTARVFLIDAYEPPFAPRLEYDAEALADTMARMNADTVRISTMGKYALIPGVRFTPHPELGKRDILAETIKACRRRGIRVVPYISTGHKLAWAMVTRDHPEYAQRTRPGGGPARSHMFVGEDHGTICWNTPYRQAFLDLIERVVRDYEVDGMYFDRWTPDYFWPGRRVCYCDGCRNGFRAKAGLEVPWHERDSEYTARDAEVIDQYHRWIQDNLIETIRTTRKLIRSHKNIPLIYNIGDAARMATEDPRIREAMDATLYERGNSILERAEGVSLARASGMGVWPYVGEYNNWPRTLHNGFDFQQQIFTTTMFGGAPILAIPWGYVQHSAARAYVSEPFSVIARNESSFAGFTNVGYAAVVHGYQTPSGHARAGTWWKHDSALASLGAFAALLYGHVQASSISERLLDDAAALSRYKVLYLADFTQVTESRAANIREFVRRGGGLVASYGTSLFDAPPVGFSRTSMSRPPVDAPVKRRERFALEDLLRVTPFEPPPDLAAVVENYRSMTGGPYDLYLADPAKPSVATLTPLWHYLPVKVLEGGEVLKDIVTGDGFRPILPGVVVSRFGKGTVVYCASALESLFVQQNSSEVGEFLRSLVAKAAPEPPPFEVDAPAAVIANLTSKGDTLVLHLTNWTGNKLERPGANEYYLAPVENVRVRLRTPAGKRIRAVSLLVNAEWSKQISGPTLSVSLPRLGAYQAIRVELGRAGRAGVSVASELVRFY